MTNITSQTLQEATVIYYICKSIQKNPGITTLQYYYEKKPQCLEIQKVRLMFKNRVEALLLQMYLCTEALLSVFWMSMD